MFTQYLKPYRRLRQWFYQWARTMGNWQPWLELSGRKILRRQVNRGMGHVFSRQLFGKGLIARAIREIFGG